MYNLNFCRHFPPLSADSQDLCIQKIPPKIYALNVARFTIFGKKLENGSVV
jgi:hypothetical protein